MFNIRIYWQFLRVTDFLLASSLYFERIAKASTKYTGFYKIKLAWFITVDIQDFADSLPVFCRVALEEWVLMYDNPEC